MRRLLREDASFRALFVGQALSLFGDRAMLLVLGVWIRDLTGSNSAAGLVFFAFALPYLAGPFWGAIVDRVSRRLLLLVVNAVMACTILALLIVDGPSSVWIIYVVAILYGAADAVTASALSALIHSTVPPDDLATVNGALQVIREGLRVVAPLLGAGLYAWVGPHTVVVIDAATFALAGLCLLLVRVAEDSPAGAGQMTFDELMAGFRHIASSSALRLVVSTTTAAFLVLGFSQTIMFALATDALGQPSSFVGVLASAQGAGAVLGGVTAARLTRAAGEVRLLGLGLVAFSSGAGLCLLPETPFVLAGMIAIGIAISWSIVGFNTSIQLRTGASLQGRAYSAAETSVAAAQTGSIAVGAFLMTLVGYVPMLIATLVVMGLAALPLIRYRDPGAVHRELTHL